MLWKVFAMVDEDHSGEMSTVVLLHFLESVFGDTDNELDGSRPRNGGSTGDVERYLRGVLDPRLTPPEVVAHIAGGRDAITFEEVKQFVLEGASIVGDTGGSSAGGGETSVIEEQDGAELGKASPARPP